MASVSEHPRIHPQKMADIYFNRMHFSALKAVRDLKHEYRESAATSNYWREVLLWLDRRVAASYASKEPARANA